MTKHCPNEECPGRRRDGVIPEFVDALDRCLDCGTRLVKGVGFAEPPPPLEFAPLRTVFIASGLVQGHLVRGMLEAEGIRVHLKGEALRSAIGELPPDVMQVEVQVPIGDEDRALEIVRCFERGAD